ncbi:Putative aminodeoxychorismate synthase [Leucoagaricus sp. SymC.cos]|nr:Putative aminodeoxychorismate synthase [Leucoagaricus sp. SymC.cos]
MTYPTAEHQPHILLIDSYCSFAYNLAALCKKAVPSSILHVIKNDSHTIYDLLPTLCQFSAIVVGPGPGSPDIFSDIGVVRDLWKVADEYMVPIFGVCLGLQSLGLEHGASLYRLDTVKHGQVSVVHHTSTDIFKGLRDVKVVRYHSLHIRLKDGGEIEELAWTEEDENGKVVMGVKHATKPFWAVQYHPESVLTDEGGLKMVENFWNLAKSWNRRNRPAFIPPPNINLPHSHIWPRVYQRHLPHISHELLDSVVFATIDVPNLSIANLCEYFGADDSPKPFVFLDSAASPGRYSILACISDSSPQITHYVNEAFIEVATGTSKQRHDLAGKGFWDWLDEYRDSRRVVGGDSRIPFWGGFIGFLSYEAGFGALNVPVRRQKGYRNVNHPDVNLVWIDRSIVIDTTCSKIWVQSLLPEDVGWVQTTLRAITNLPGELKPTPAPRGDAIIKFPDYAQYIAKIKSCKEYLFSGNSYELCLIDQTHITVPKEATISTWERYKLLRSVNAAPHGAYLRLHPTTFLSSSPERFLSYSRSPGTVCQLRPIKGTVRKLPHITREVAEEMLAGSKKEIAENLMIVDLIRHDLHNAVGENVVTKKFCGIEEYEHVWQLVSVIEGSLPDGTPVEIDDTLGWEVLRRSLPPGSMTGAPKKRSVELLQSIEGKERGPYSGVFGYWCAGGGGDWSVTIRSCFLHDSKKDGDEEWVIGAGGAITALSDPEDEWEEMKAKLNGVLRGFGASC